MAEVDGESELELRDYLALLGRRWRLIALVTVATVAVALALAVTETPRYRASTDVLVESGTAQELFDPVTGRLSDPDRDIQNEIEFVESTSVEEAVEEQLGFEAQISAQARDDADVIVLSAEDEDPERAALVANEYAETYLELRRSRTVTEYQQAAGVVESNLADVIGELSSVQERLDEIAEQLFAPAFGTPVEQLSQEQATLEARRFSLQEERISLEESLRQLELSGDLAREGRATITDPAEAPADPVSPRPLRSAVLAGVVGLIIGTGLAFLRDYLDDSIRSKDDLETALGGRIPVLGLIPEVPGWRQADEARVVTIEEPGAPASEAFRSLRTSVSFLGLDRELRVVSISSARSAEGKTATCANLATVLARAGHQVVVVDCDLRKPRLHEFLGLPQAPGLTTAVLGGGLDELVRTVDSVPGLTLLSAGEVPPDPAELLASTRTAEVFTQLREGYDIVIVDTAPVLPVTDALIVSKLADATLLVGSVTGSSRRDVHRARELLDQVQAPLVGAVLNNVRAGSDDGYGYGRRPGPTETGDDSTVTPPTRAADADAHSPSV